MDYAALHTEISTDPVVLGYAGKTDQQIADLLNSLTTSRTLPRTRVDTTDILGAIQDSAWPAVASTAESKLRAILSMPSVDATSTNIRAMLGTIFPNSGNTATTRANLLALATRVVSRQEELGLGPVVAIDVTRSNSGVW